MFVFGILVIVVFCSAQVGAVVLLPMYIDALQKHTVCGRPRPIGNLYIVLFFSLGAYTFIYAVWVLIAKLLTENFSLQCAVPQRLRFFCGAAGAVFNLLLVFSSPPSRTPVSIQPLLTAAIIPLTAVIRWLMLGKQIDAPRRICALATAIGIVIAMEPVLFNMNVEQASQNGHSSHQWAWSLLFLLAMVPLAVVQVISEEAMKMPCPNVDDTAFSRSLLFVLWAAIWTFLLQAAFFFTDFIPWFGQSRSFGDFSRSMRQGFGCMFGSAPTPSSYTNCTAQQYLAATGQAASPDPHCETPIFRFWLMAVFYCSVTLLMALLVKFSEGAVYAVLVSSLCAPLGSVFWMLFKLDHRSHFSWMPMFPPSAVYVVIGLFIVMPAIAVYNYLDYLDGRGSIL